MAETYVRQVRERAGAMWKTSRADEGGPRPPHRQTKDLHEAEHVVGGWKYASWSSFTCNFVRSLRPTITDQLKASLE